MTTQQQERLAETVLDQLEERNLQSEWWRRNASARHGVPFAEKKRPVNITIKDERPQTQQQDEPEQQPSQVPNQTDLSGDGDNSTKQSWWDLLKFPLAASAVALPLGLGGGYLASKYFDDGNKDASITKPTDQPKNGSLFQYLEDQGYHVED